MPQKCARPSRDLQTDQNTINLLMHSFMIIHTTYTFVHLHTIDLTLIQSCGSFAIVSLVFQRYIKMMVHWIPRSPEIGNRFSPRHRKCQNQESPSGNAYVCRPVRIFRVETSATPFCCCSTILLITVTYIGGIECQPENETATTTTTTTTTIKQAPCRRSNHVVYVSSVLLELREMMMMMMMMTV